MAKHAMLSASGASRWLTCTPSAVYETQFKEQESIYADEGTLAHELANYYIQHLGFGTLIDRRVKDLMENEMYSDEMLEYVLEYAQYVVDKYREIPGSAILMLEQRLDLREYIPGGFGTIDVGIVYDGWMETVDLKYGKGVPVDAFENKQQMVYALGALEECDILYDIHSVRMTIYQPRINNISSYEISVENLKKWGYSVLKPTAQIAYQGGGDFVAGEHCRFCRARATCVTNAAYNLTVAKLEFAPPQEISPEQVVKILLRAQGIRRWLTSIEDHALAAALGGTKLPGMKVVKGRSVRKYTDEAAIIKGLLDAGYSEEIIINKKLSGITQLSKNITKLHFEEIVEQYVNKPPGKPSLVYETDARPEFNSGTSAADDFVED